MLDFLARIILEAALFAAVVWCASWIIRDSVRKMLRTEMDSALYGDEHFVGLFQRLREMVQDEIRQGITVGTKTKSLTLKGQTFHFVLTQRLNGNFDCGIGLGGAKSPTMTPIWDKPEREANY